MEVTGELLLKHNKYIVKHNTVYCEVFHAVHSLRAIMSLIFQLNANYIIEYIHLLPNISYMFRSVLHHPQGERRIICSKLIAIATGYTLQ